MALKIQAVAKIYKKLQYVCFARKRGELFRTEISCLRGERRIKKIHVSREIGFAILFWSVDTLDWKTRNTDSVYNAVMKDAADRAIVLDHDLYGTTADAMARIIPELIEQGYQLVTVSELLKYSGISQEAGTVYSSGK